MVSIHGDSEQSWDCLCFEETDQMWDEIEKEKSEITLRFLV